VPLRRSASRTSVIILGLLTLAVAPAVGLVPGDRTAYALDEAQLTDPTCAGAVLSQHGLPPGVPVLVHARDAETGAALFQANLVVPPSGDLRLPLRMSLRGVRQLVVDVESGANEQNEFGEAAADVHAVCPVPGQSAAVHPTATVPLSAEAARAEAGTPRTAQAAATSAQSGADERRGGAGSWPAAAALAVCAVGGGAVALRMRARRDADAGPPAAAQVSPSSDSEKA
jgi:hypothetical protein